MLSVILYFYNRVIPLHLPRYKISHDCFIAVESIPSIFSHVQYFILYRSYLQIPFNLIYFFIEWGLKIARGNQPKCIT